ncbi:MAG: GTPase domain-containing protein [Promethearchaeia archaeon]
MFKLKPPEILLTGEKGVGKSTILNLFPGENILEIDLNLNEIIKKPIKIDNLKEINQCILRIIDLDELIRNLISYRDLLKSIQIICIVTDSTKTNLESTQQSYLELEKNIQAPDYFIIGNFQDNKKVALKAEKIEQLLGVKTYGFSAVQKDSRKKLIAIIKDILRLSILEKEEADLIKPKQNDIEIVELKETYLDIWSEIEEAAILGKQGEHIIAAKRFSNTTSQLKEYNTKTNLKEEREEIGVIYNLCKAWESMELGEETNEPQKYSEAINFFNEASSLTSDNRSRLFILGNSKFCKALQLGLEFDLLNNINIKENNYNEIKLLIKESADLFKEAGFENEANWALATEIYLKATWYLTKADVEHNLDKKKKIIDQVSGFFKTAAKLFGDAGYKKKEKEILGKIKNLI